MFTETTIIDYVLSQRFVSIMKTLQVCQSAPSYNHQSTLFVVSLCCSIVYNKVLCCFLSILYTSSWIGNIRSRFQSAEVMPDEFFISCYHIYVGQFKSIPPYLNFGNAVALWALNIHQQQWFSVSLLWMWTQMHQRWQIVTENSRTPAKIPSSLLSMKSLINWRSECADWFGLLLKHTKMKNKHFVQNRCWENSWVVIMK